MYPASGALIGRQTGLNGATNLHVVPCLTRIEDVLANVIAFGEHTRACLSNPKLQVVKRRRKGVYSVIHRPTLIPNHQANNRVPKAHKQPDRNPRDRQ